MKDLCFIRHKIKNNPIKGCFAFYFTYAGLGASTGQTPAQAPHSIHSSASITYRSSPSEIQDTGHSASQAPQLIQSSLIK